MLVCCGCGSSFSPQHIHKATGSRCHAFPYFADTHAIFLLRVQERGLRERMLALAAGGQLPGQATEDGSVQGTPGELTLNVHTALPVGFQAATLSRRTACAHS